MKLFCTEDHDHRTDFRKSLVGERVFARIDGKWNEAKVLAEKMVEFTMFHPARFSYLVEYNGKVESVDGNELYPAGDGMTLPEDPEPVAAGTIVATAKRDLEKGELVSAEDVETKPEPADDFEPDPEADDAR